ncbi:MAG: FMN-binding negative transcriptional regulator [Sphingobacteriales bacterium]|nr:FMN-binding negative transcriptional regulator [Sphingobacteriales bacterium]
MYNYPHYKENDREKLLAFMHQYPFITLIGADAGGRVEATQVPVLIEEKEGKIFITGHIARKSSHHKALSENPQALLIFTGPHAYVSGSWYTGSPQQASTWNYISVHARGTIRWTEEVEMTGILKKLSLHFEQGNTASPTIYDNLPAAYLEKLVKAIIGFEVEVTELDNVLKLSQNRDEKSYDTIVSELKKQEGDARLIGDLMESRKTKVFPS